MDKNAQRDRAAGKRRIIDLLTEGHVPRPDGGYYPGLYVTRNCTFTIAEWEQLHYKENVSKEDAGNAFAGEDHAFDDARYFVQSRPFPARPREDADWMRDYQKSLSGGRGTSFYDLTGTSAYA
jgi:hypothetical protein